MKNLIITVFVVLLFSCSAGERATIVKRYTDGVTINLGNIVIGRDGSVHSDPIAYNYCKSLGFDGFEDEFRYDDNAGVLGGHYEITYFCKKDLKKKNEATVNQTKDKKNNPVNNLDKFKNQCASLGFKKGTEKFADCVLELSK